MNNRRLKSTSYHLKGIAVSPGYAIGSVQLVAPRNEQIAKHRLKESDIEGELERFNAALQASDEQLQSIKERLETENQAHAAIIEMHQLMLHDDLMCNQTARLIREEKLNAEWAFTQVVSDLRSQFEAIDDEYFRDRSSDLNQVSDRILRNLQGDTAPLMPQSANDAPHILVGRDLSPADTAQIHNSKTIGFITEYGGRTSHTAITARALGLPAIVGIQNATSLISGDQKLILDGISGEVIVNPSREEIEYYLTLSQNYDVRQHRLQENISQQAVTQDGEIVHILGNIVLPREAGEAFKQGAEGIGLFRSEFLYMGRPTLPSEEEQARQYRSVLEVSGPEGAVIRTLDVGGDKVAKSISLIEEANPIMGLRAIRFCLQHPQILRSQLKALLRASPYGQLKILVPMISCLEELRAFKAIFEDCRREVLTEGVDLPPKIPLGIMIELPSAALIADLLAREVDFFSIGTNDLIQYTIGVDRTNEQVSQLYRPLHPAILRLIDRVCRAAQEAQIPVSICGEMAGDLFYMPLLLGLGLRTLSMSTGNMAKIKAAIRLLKMTDCQALAEQALTMPTASDCAEFLSRELKIRLQDLGYPEDLEVSNH